MKKRNFAVLLVAALMLTFCINAGAEGQDYTLSELKITTDNISVKVDKSADTEGPAKIYIAMYDDYDALLGIVSDSVDLASGESTIISKTMYPNRAVTVKAFVWSGICTASSTIIYKTTRPGGEIEDGGEA